MADNPEFFLGIKRDGEEEKFLVPSTFFLTHAVVLGASGSGKTVMCKSIVEEAIRNDIPVIAFDPKGDIGALGIGLGGDFNPENVMIHAEVEGKDVGKDPEVIAEKWMDLYREKLEESYGEEYSEAEGEYSRKIAVILITPKNPAGIQISMTSDFEKPPNYDEMMEKSPDTILSALDLKLQLLLSRCGIKGASSTDNRVIFLSQLVRHNWEEGGKKSVSLGDVIEMLEAPPIDKVGNLSVDKFISKNKRGELARLINALMVRAVPGVEMNFDKLVDLAKKKEKVPIIVFDLRGIQDEEERTSFVAEVLGEVQRWVWSKGGTSRLRAILYFDELYGFMPAGSRSPPSKTALLIIIKQARAAGLGCVLATQNPGDLDYRGLSNISSWFLGRLTTPQDIAKVESALKAVFEATGGSEAEFKALMSSMRALKPGQFIAYNPNTGVVPIRTRWLLSLHKGPLTDGEIDHLTLKPPKKAKKKKKDAASKAKPAGEEEEAELPEIELISTKPVIKKHLERFLRPQIKINEKIIRKLINDRLNLFGKSKKDGLELTIEGIQPFYSPIFYFRLNLNIKRNIIAGTINIPIEISQEMTRSFDLSTQINWDSMAVEGIHPSSIPPADLVLDPEEGNYSYFNFPKDRVDKISKNVIWYFTNQPFPEAENIYQEKIRDFERTQVESLAGAKPKKIKKVSEQISRLEERASNENNKKTGYEKRLDQLSADKRGLIAEGKSTKGVERSIESSNNQILRIEERMSDLRVKIDDLEKQRAEALQANEEEYKKLIGQITKLKRQGAPPDLYKPGKADIKTEEEAIYWVPRVLVNLSAFKTDHNEDGSIQTKFALNLNIYNGNGEVSCAGCGKEASTRNYYQKLLEDEISPPTFICSVCLGLFCSEHLDFCVKCGSGACYEHIEECSVCKTAVCSDCGITCEICGKQACEEHGWKCSTCGKELCGDESKELCEQCGDDAPKCPECAADNLYTCVECQKRLCEEHRVSCGSCGQTVCSTHLKKCRKCSLEVCDKCARVKAKLKGEEVVVRCADCS